MYEINLIIVNQIIGVVMNEKIGNKVICIISSTDNDDFIPLYGQLWPL